MSILSRRNLVPALALGVAIATGLAPAVQAQSTTVTGPGGRSATGTTTREGGNVNQTLTGPGGHSASRNVTRDPATGNATATLTGPRGQSATRSTTR